MTAAALCKAFFEALCWHAGTGQHWHVGSTGTLAAVLAAVLAADTGTLGSGAVLSVSQADYQQAHCQPLPDVSKRIVSQTDYQLAHCQPV